MRFRPLNPALFAGAASLLLLALHMSAAWADCTPSPGAPPPETGYTGYAPTGYKGAQERDPVWFHNVRSRTRPDGTVEYRLRRRHAAWFDSIEPLAVNQRTVGYVARKNGCSHLLDRRGKPLAVPAFDTIEEDWNSHVRGLFRLRSSNEDSGHYRYIRFVRGKLKAVSPHEYLMSYSSSTLEQTHLPPYLRLVTARSDNGHGLLDLRTLRETLAPEWHGVSGVGLYESKRPNRYLLADNGEARTLFSLDGRHELMSGMDTIEIVPEWFPFDKKLEAAERAVIAIRLKGENGCRLYDIHLHPLLPHLIPAENGKCLARHAQEDKFFFAGNSDGQIRIYAIGPAPHVTLRGIVEGQEETGLRDTGLLVIRVETPAGRRYRVFSADGQRANEEEFDDFRHLGCGFLEVHKDGRWLTLYHNGKTTEKRYYPFSC